MRILTCSLVYIAFVGVLPAQEEPLTAIERAIENETKLKVTVALDRSEYFPGELVDITITIENPTVKALEIRKPFVDNTGTIALLEKGNLMAKSYGQEYGPMGSGPSTIELGDSAPIPTVIIGPGETLVRKLHSYDHTLADGGDLLFHGAAPIWGGDFRVAYWARSADFRVVMPVFEGMIKISMPEWEEKPSGTRLQKNVYAFALSAEGKYYVCLDKDPYAGKVDTPRTSSDGRLMDREFHMNRYSRVAESDAPIVSLKGSADAAGNVLLSWGEAGAQRVIVQRSELLAGTRKPH